MVWTHMTYPIPSGRGRRKNLYLGSRKQWKNSPRRSDAWTAPQPPLLRPPLTRYSPPHGPAPGSPGVAEDTDCAYGGSPCAQRSACPSPRDSENLSSRSGLINEVFLQFFQRIFKIFVEHATRPSPLSNFISLAN